MNKNVTINISGLGYIIIGLLVYLMIGDYNIFTWADPWLYIYMVFWPFVLIWFGLVWAAIIAAIVFVVYMIGWGFDRRR